MALSGWLIDKSALVRLPSSADAALWAERIERRMVSICTVTRLEIGYSARSVGDRDALFSRPPISALMVENLTPASEDRALEVQGLLTDVGQHRAPSLADLLLAAVAEQRRLTVLHVDKDFDLIASVTGQPVETLRL